MIYSFGIGIEDEKYQGSNKIRKLLKGLIYSRDFVAEVELNTSDGKVEVEHYISKKEKAHIFINKKNKDVISVLLYNSLMYDLTEAEIGTNVAYEKKGYTSAIYCYLVEWSPTKKLYSDLQHYTRARGLWAGLCKYGNMSRVYDWKVTDKNLNIKDINDKRIWTPYMDYTFKGEGVDVAKKVRLMLSELNDAGRDKFKIKRNLTTD